MKALVDPVLMKKAIGHIAPVIGNNQVISALSCLKMDFNGRGLKITGTNLKAQVEVETACEGKSKFSLVMPVDKFKDICDKAEGPLLIELTEKQIKLSDDNDKWNLPISGEPDVFPIMKPDEYIFTYKADGDFFYSLEAANDAGSKNPQEVQLVNALIDFKKDGITIFGTDRIVVYRKDFKFKTKTPIQAHVISYFVNLTKSFQESEVQVCENYIAATYKNVSVTARLSDQRYPDYTVMNPKKPVVYNVLVNREDLIKKIKKLGCVADQNNKDIIFTFEPHQIKMESYDITFGLSGETVLPASNDTPSDLEPVRLSGARLLPLLNSIQEENIKMSFTDPKAFVFMKPEDDDTTIIYLSPMAILNQ